MIQTFFFILFAGLFFITNLYENYCREKEGEWLGLSHITSMSQHYGKSWHWFQWLNWALVIGFVSYLIFGFTILTISVILLIGAVWWILFDGGLNRLKGRSFFHQSEYSTSVFEAFASAKVKLTLLIISIIFLVITL